MPWRDVSAMARVKRPMLRSQKRRSCSGPLPASRPRAARKVKKVPTERTNGVMADEGSETLRGHQSSRNSPRSAVSQHVRRPSA